MHSVDKPFFLLIVDLDLYIVGTSGSFEFFINTSFYECHNFKNWARKKSRRRRAETYPTLFRHFLREVQQKIM